MKCPYCGSNARLKDSSVIYGKSYGMVYVCKNYPKCNAYVGCHKGTSKPLGRLSDEKLRKMKKNLHGHFDVLWKKGYMSRTEAYQLLSDLMGLPPRKTHIGMFDEDQCKEALEKIDEYKNGM